EGGIELQRPAEGGGRVLLMELLELGHAHVVGAVGVLARSRRGRRRGREGEGGQGQRGPAGSHLSGGRGPPLPSPPGSRPAWRRPPGRSCRRASAPPPSPGPGPGSGRR